MAINVGRKMTDTDTEKLQAAAVRYCKKWGIDCDDQSALDYAEGAETFAAYPEIAAEMRRDWKARVKRALGGYTTWGYGYVGHEAD